MVTMDPLAKLFYIFLMDLLAKLFLRIWVIGLLSKLKPLHDDLLVIDLGCLDIYRDKTPAAANSLACEIDPWGSMLDDCSNPCSNDSQPIPSSAKTAHASMLHEFSNIKLQCDRDKTPAAADSLACEIDPWGSMLDDCSNPCSNDSQPIPSSAKTAHAPMLHEFSNIKLQCDRGIDLPTGYGMLQANEVNMINDAPNPTMPHKILLDTGSPDHHSGFSSWFGDESQEVYGKYITGVGGARLDISRRGPISDANFQVKGVNYVPGLNRFDPNTGRIIFFKTIFSQNKLRLEKCAFEFPVDGSVIVYRGTHPLMPWWRKIVGKGHVDGHGYYLMDYLKITDDEPTLWTAACSVWNKMGWPVRDRAQNPLLPR